jgi:hypothetical protein
MTGLPIRWLAMAVVLNATFGIAQHPSAPNRLIVPVIGTVQGIFGNVISVATGAGIEEVATNPQTEIWKGTMFHDLSPVQIGDDFKARCYSNASGKLMADVVWLNIVNFFGIVTKVESGGDSFEVFTNPNADPHSAYVQKTLTISVDADTIFEASAKDDLRLGRGVQMVGLDLKNGTIRATRLTVYEGKRPVRMGNGKVIAPDGTLLK